MYFHVILFYYGDGIRSDELRKQIGALRAEVRTISRFMNIKQEDLRTVLGEQIRPVLLEKVDHFFSDVRSGTLKPGRRKERERELLEFVNEAIQIFQREGKARAMEHLDERGPDLLASISAERDAPVRKFAGELIDQLGSYYEMSDGVLMPPPAQPQVPSPPSRERPLSPALVEETLAPLASSWRMNILMHLSGDDDGLAALSRSLGLKKGHLQFHLKVLTGADLIAYDRKSHLYSITPKGARAIEGVSRLVDDLASTRR